LLKKFLFSSSCKKKSKAELILGFSGSGDSSAVSSILIEAIEEVFTLGWE